MIHVLSGMEEICHLKSQILPQKNEKFETFCSKNCKILQIQFTNRRTSFRAPKPGIIH